MIFHNFISRILFAFFRMINFIPLCLILSLAYGIVFYLKKKKFFVRKIILFFLFLLYFFTMTEVTGTFQAITNMFTLEGYMAPNLIPLIHGNPLQMILNVILMLPMGIFLPLIFSNIHWTFSKIIGVGCFLILLIETLQFFGGRCWDIDDVIMNLLGMSLGYLIYHFYSKSKKGQR